MNIAVYLSSTFGVKEEYALRTKELGSWIGKNHHTLVYGGSKTGLMDILSDAVLEEGGKVIGVETTFFAEQGKGKENLTEFILTPDMKTRKEKMRSLADASIALPGGVGTLDEIAETICLDTLSTKHKPILFYNVAHYYDPLKEQFDKMVEEGFLRKEFRNRISFCDTLEEIEARLATK